MFHDQDDNSTQLSAAVSKAIFAAHENDWIYAADWCGGEEEMRLLGDTSCLSERLVPDRKVVEIEENWKIVPQEN